MHFEVGSAGVRARRLRRPAEGIRALTKVCRKVNHFHCGAGRRDADWRRSGRPRSPAPTERLQRHGPAGNPAGGPGRLKVEAAGDAVDVEQFAGEVQSGTYPALHRSEIHIAQFHAAAGDEFVLVQALSGDFEVGANELQDQGVLRGPRKGCPSRLVRNSGGDDQLRPQPRGQWRDGRIDDQSAGLVLAARAQFGRNFFRVPLRQPI
jgi:hypothetical protein